MIFFGGDTALRASVQHSSGGKVIGQGGGSRVGMPVNTNLVRTVLSWSVCMYVCGFRAFLSMGGEERE